MKRRELINLGLEGKETLKQAGLCVQQAMASGLTRVEIRKDLQYRTWGGGDRRQRPGKRAAPGSPKTSLASLLAGYGC